MSPWEEGEGSGRALGRDDVACGVEEGQCSSDRQKLQEQKVTEQRSRSNSLPLEANFFLNMIYYTLKIFFKPWTG